MRPAPAAFGRQKHGQNAYTFALLLDQIVVLSYPGPHDLAHMEGGVNSDPQPRGFANRLQMIATPLRNLGGDGAYWTSCDEAQRHLLANRISCRTVLPKHPVTGQRFGIRITFLPSLFQQAHRQLCILPGMQARKRDAAPPHPIQKPNCTAWLCARPGDQAIACLFFAIERIGTGNPMFGPSPNVSQAPERLTNGLRTDLAFYPALLDTQSSGQ
jgi:hypothetical protein